MSDGSGCEDGRCEEATWTILNSRVVGIYKSGYHCWKRTRSRAKPSRYPMGSQKSWAVRCRSPEFVSGRMTRNVLAKRSDGIVCIASTWDEQGGSGFEIFLRGVSLSEPNLMRHQQSIFERNVDPSTGSDSVVVVGEILLAFASTSSRTMLSSRLRRQVLLNVADPDLVRFLSAR